MRRVRVVLLVLLVSAGLSGVAPPAQAAAGAINVRMPFAGYWDRFDIADPSYHLPESSTREGDWAVDIYQAAGVAVRALVTVPKGAKVKLRVLSVAAIRCPSDGKPSGKTVKVEVQRDGKPLGWVSYAHLDQVPSAIKKGAVISNGATLGNLKMWPKSCYWQVNNPQGVHTHLVMASYRPQFACYRPLAGGSKRYDTNTWIGTVGKTKATKKERPC